VLGVFRSIPDIIWAYLFVRLVGLGPGPAVLAIGISTGGIIGKLFAELAEATDPEPIHALRRAGIGRLGILIHGVLPQVQRQWVGYALFRLECSIRSASILGVVGAGGLGSEIALSVRYFEYDKLATALLAVLAYVIAFEIISALLRRCRIKWTLWSAAAGSLVALAYLDIPWTQMWASNMVPDAMPAIGGPEAAAMVRRAVSLIFETIAMAWCATIAAAALAFVIAPLASGTLTVGSHRKDSPRARGPTRYLVWAMLLAARLVLQVCRAMPELTLALIFVVWVGPGPFAGVLAVGLHTVGVLGRLYTDVYEEVEPGPVGALESTGASRLGIWIYGVIPQVAPRIMAFTLYRFEVNVRATAMVGFVGAGGIGDAIHTAISLFHTADLILLLAVILGVVTLLDAAGDRVRFRILTARFGPRAPRASLRTLGRRRSRQLTEQLMDPPISARQDTRRAMHRRVFFRRPGDEEMRSGHATSGSMSGMFIDTASPQPPGAILEVTLSPADTGHIEALESAKARVIYTSEGKDKGMGIELIDPGPRFLALVAATWRTDDELVTLTPETTPEQGEDDG
jgi:phosphonate transport system permease protein